MNSEVMFRRNTAAGLTVVSLLLFTSFSAHANEKEILTRAQKLTVSKDFSGAEKAYKELLSANPDEGFPAIARFYHRTGQTSSVQELINSPDFLKQSSLVKARTYTAAALKEKSIEILQNTTPETSTSLYASALLLSNQLQRAGKKDEAGAVLEKYAVATELSSADREDLFARLIKLSGPPRLQKLFPEMINELMSSTTLSFPDTRKIAWNGLMILGQNPGYAEFHRSLKEKRTTAANYAWLYAMSCIKKGDSPEATAALETFSTASLTNRDKLFINEELARLFASDPSRSLSLYESVLPLAPDKDRVRLQIARLDFRLKRFDQSVKVLKEVKWDNLDDGERQACANILMTSLGVTGPMNEVVSEFARITKTLSYNLKRELATAPLIFIEPTNQVNLRQAIERAVKEDEKTNSNSLLILMSLENQMGNGKAVSDTLERYVNANPNDIDAAIEYAQARAGEAYSLTRESKTSPTQEQLNATADKAARAYWKVIKLRPYAPESYENLMNLYTLFGMTDKAKAVPQYLLEQKDPNAEEIHTAAYIYAKRNYPEEAIPLYERALKMEDNPRYRVNYAAALTRANRYDEALAIYKELIEKGVNGKEYHLHELLEGALKAAGEAGQSATLIEYLRNLPDTKKLPAPMDYIHETGVALSKSGYGQDSIGFFERLRDEYPDQNAMATDLIINTYASLKDYPKAKEILRGEIEKATDKETQATLRNNMAILSLRSGDINLAIAEWEELAKAIPDVQVASRGYINAGNALLKAGRVEQAKDYFRKFLQQDSGDPDGEQMAREQLAKLGALDIPVESVVDSAVQEYAPDAPPIGTTIRHK